MDSPIDVFVLELGANDLIRGMNSSQTFNNLQQIISIVKIKNPLVKILLLGMKLPTWIPGDRAIAFRNIYERLDNQNELELLPFLLEGVAGKQYLNMIDGVHPLAEGYKVIAENVWTVLLRILIK